MKLTRSFIPASFAVMLKATPKAALVAGDGFAMNVATGAMPNLTRQTAITFAYTARNKLRLLTSHTATMEVRNEVDRREN